ncbi:uncharacterized protein N7484_008839 [Penicillium longicatenatum]|uniref:uncharacterized protein n=1 Tax=Penicillium longicatenatum TaxID=1561947 RepID=UPI0025473D27|nr:uncharacterized protein N7484_008839 [Penicillium longicatenatum]KAJ5635526.1 hypothetical protein N7484_008839 [Penicillium longicatenatum]
MSEDLRDDCPELKRRKVRKGTQSCWECKRRKVRCIFASHENASCSNCRRRGTACISQELPDTLVPPVDSQVDSRLGRVEELIEILAHNAGINKAQDGSNDKSSTHTTLTALEDEERLRRNTVPSAKVNPSPQNERICRQKEPSLVAPRDRDRRLAGKHEAVTRELIMAWPSQEDLEFICTLPGGPTMRLTGGILTQCPGTLGRILSLKEILQLPPPGSHPVLIARKLLMLGTFLCGVPPSKIQELGSLGTLYTDIMTRAIDTAIRLVTTNDELTCSVEGIECIMMEAFYHNHSGNLHRSWMTVHRATAVAQMMAIHRGLESPSLRILESTTRETFNEAQICFRLVQMDRYLSLMLGLPPTSLEATFATPKALEGCNPMERLERIHCVVAEHILRRTEADLIDLTKTHEDDKLLQKIAADMPAQWWLMPSFIPSSEDPELMGDIIRLMDQFAHYHLLIRLHLPYMLRASPKHRYDHSRITAVTASRDILSRYLAFRTSSPVYFYCRGDECLALIAIVVLCAAHINSRKQHQQSSETDNYDTVFNFLAHSRPSDRAMMERAFEVMKSSSRGLDSITSKFVQIIHHLLIIETSAASGTSYSTSSSKGDKGELEFFGTLADDGKALHIYIPYFGKINFERRTISKDPTTALLSEQTEQGYASLAGSDGLAACQNGDQLGIPNPKTGTSQFEQLSSPESNQTLGDHWDTPPELTHTAMDPWVDDWDLQGIDIALFDSLFRGTDIFNVDE